MKSKKKTIFLILLLFSITSMLLIWVQEVPDDIIQDNVLSPQTGQEPVSAEDKESSEEEIINIKLSENNQEPVSPIPTEGNEPSEKSSDLETTELITSSTILIEPTPINISNSTFAITDDGDDATTSSNISSTITKTNQNDPNVLISIAIITTATDYSKDTNVPTAQ